MKRHNITGNHQGFTLVEIIAVLLLLGILAAIAVPKYIDLTAEATDKAIDTAIAELNSRENLEWSKAKLKGTMDDPSIKAAVLNRGLGDNYTITASSSGATVTFEGKTVTLARTAADEARPALWSR